jgi:hypothetical protein
MANSTGSEATHKTSGETNARTLSVLYLVGSVFTAMGRYFAWPGQPWVEALWVTLALAVTIVWLNRNLPLQNVLLAMATVVSLGFVALVAAEAGKPGNSLALGLAPIPGSASAKYVQSLTWALLLLNAQGVARFILTRKEESTSYGFWVIGIAGALVGGFQLGLEAAVGPPLHQTWVFKTATLAGWYCFAVLCLVLASPALLKRKPGERARSIEPVWVWIGLNLLVMATAASRGLWMVATIQGAVTALGSWPGLRSFRNR